MASKPPAACCASGFKHEGNPVGEIKNVDGGELKDELRRTGYHLGKNTQLIIKMYLTYSRDLHHLP